jgi:hypothetical protein
VDHDSMLSVSDLQQVVNDFKNICKVPDDPWEQLHMAITSVFLSWYSPRAIKYRDINRFCFILFLILISSGFVEYFYLYFISYY